MNSMGKDGLSILKNSLKQKSDSTCGYEKIIEEAKVVSGMFTVIWKEKEGKLYFELPPEVFGKPFMLANRVSQTSDAQDYAAGQMINQLLLHLSCDEHNVYLHQMQVQNITDGKDAISAAVAKNNSAPVLKGFKIAERNGDNLVIDVTSFFSTNEKCISPLKESTPATKLLGGGSGLKGTFQSDASSIISVKAFPENIEIKSMLSYMTTGVVQKPYTVKVHRSLYLLSEEPMKMRLHDDRVGYFHTYKNLYSSSDDRINERKYIHRWRIEPKPGDLDAYNKGVLVEPAKPIVFYVDTAFPEKWRQAVKDGILVWNKAFEAAGFKNAIQAIDYPSDSTGFDPDDMRNSCFRYVGTSTANAMGPSYEDPRTGEILSADVIWYHNIISLLHTWRFVQTSAVDPQVRTSVFPDSIMQEALRYAAAHEIGHTLGLMHNMGASYAYPVDSLRSPSFTRKYGTTPSIMDYARNNYVAQPGDLERGVKLTPPDIGVYDIYAINWGYRLIDGAGIPEDEKPTLDKWIANHDGDRMFEFGAQQIFGIVDPTDQTEDLGNDHIEASSLAVSNLKITLSHLAEWTYENGGDYDYLEVMYKEVVNQYKRYIDHVVPYIGGTEFKEIRQGDGNTNARCFINKQEQLEAMKFVTNELRTMNEWIKPAGLINLFEAPVSQVEQIRKTTVGKLLSSALLYRITEGAALDSGNCYTASAYLEDLTPLLFHKPESGKLSDVDKELQAEAIDVIIKQSGLAPLQKDASSTASKAKTELALLTDVDNVHWCSADRETSFTRFNVANGSLSKANVGALMLSRLKTIRKLYRSWRRTAKADTRDFLDYQLMVIGGVLKNSDN